MINMQMHVQLLTIFSLAYSFSGFILFHLHKIVKKKGKGLGLELICPQ